MKRIFIMIAALIIATSVWAQSPEKMSYQAVIRDANNNLLTNQAVGMQISILRGSATASAVYVETHNITSNENGLVTLEIGMGSVVSGGFTTIDWPNDTYFIKTETDPTGGTNYTISGTNQLMSVPYALHAKTAESISGGIAETDPVFGASAANGISETDISNWNNHTADTHIDSTGIAELGFVAEAHYLGEEFGGGIIYYLFIGSDGKQHGLIVNKNQSASLPWQTTGTSTNATRSWDGSYNTSQMTDSEAATYVNGLNDGGFTDWYIPSIDELNLLYYNRFSVNKALHAGGHTLLTTSSYLWSSTELNIPTAFYFSLIYGNSATLVKSNTLPVRAIRAF